MRKLTIFAVLALAFALLFGSCGQVKEEMQKAAKGDIQQGTWSEDGKTFTNAWSGIKFTLPGGYTASTQEQIDAVMQAGMEATGQTGVGANIALMRVVYDFMVQVAGTGMPNVMLLYENVNLNAAMNGVDESGYLDVMKTQFDALAVQGVEYKEQSRGTATVAGVEWTQATFSLNDAAYQQYYLHLKDGYMWQMVITYTTDDEANAIVGAFEAA